MNREEARLRELGLWPPHGLLPRQGRPDVVVAGPSGAVQPAVGSLDWAPLEAAIRACEGCDLCRSRRQAVPGAGARNARVLVVGDAPVAEEEQRGEPFVGLTGELLDQMLLAVGLDRRRVYLANAIKCRPPEDREPPAEAFAACVRHLERQVALLQPAVILALGSVAARALLGVEGEVGALRGGQHLHAGVPVVVSHHPGHLLRSPQQKLLAWEDLCRLKDILAASTAQGADAAPVAADQSEAG